MAQDGDLANPLKFELEGPWVVTVEGIIKNRYEPNGSLRVTLQDSTAPLSQYYIQTEQKTDITLTTDVAIGDDVINVSAGHGFTGASGEQLTIFENNRFEQLKVVSVATNAITVEHPVTAQFTIAEAFVMRGNILMNVDGSSTPVEFNLNLRKHTIPIDITKVVITMQHGTNVPDDGKFGGLGALTNGLFFKKEDGSTFSLGNYITNQDFKDMGGVVTYTEKAPAGTNATCITFNIKEIFGQVIRLKPTDLDMIIGTVRDNISAGAGMVKMTVSFIGHYTEGEA